jgi:HD-GYP domain-containing protein (c-di-GMP phosphodiesterase class II)
MVIIEALGSALDARDSYTEGHGRRAAEMAVKLYDALGLNDPKQRRDLFMGGLLHDVGKIGIPDRILKSSEILSPEDFEVIKQHPMTGYNICKGLSEDLGGALDVIKYHHERLDGSGYPNKLEDGNIPILAQIMAVVDVYDALTSRRSYRDEMNQQKAFAIMREEANTGKLNKEFVEAFIDLAI